MGQITPPVSSVASDTIVYKDLRGANFVNRLSDDRSRAADMVNMISDEGGDPRKRCGWEIKHTTSGSIENLWTFIINGSRYFVAAVGTDIIEYKLATGFVTAGKYTGTKTGKRAGFFMASLAEDITEQALYILNGDEYLKCYLTTPLATQLTIEPVEPYVPTLLVARSPTGSPNAGTVLESINLLTRERKEEFINSPAENTTFLCSSEIDTTKPYSAKYLDAGGEWQDATISTVSGATVTLSAAYAPPVATEDNIRIQYHATGSSKAARITNCSVQTIYNQTTNDQVFVSGNPNYPQYVWYSGSSDPTYFPDTNYLFVGGSGSAIMGFMVVSGYMAVVKEISGNEATVFLLYTDTLQTTETDTSGNTTTVSEDIYKVQSTSAGVGAISKYCFKALADEPLFLSADGIQGMVSVSTTSDKIIRNRSKFLNPKLLKEGDIENAIAETWNNYYVLCVNNHCYILDGRNKTSDNANNTSYGYEAYYWDNVPANCFMVYDGELWFGTVDGNVCRFKTTDDMYPFNDNDVAITTRWATPYDDDKGTQYLKTMLKRGSGLTLKSTAKSTVNVYVKVDNGGEQLLGTYALEGGFSFSDIDFSSLSFGLAGASQDVVFGIKIKKYQRMQIIIENSTLNEDFCLNKIFKTVEYVKLIK